MGARAGRHTARRRRIQAGTAAIVLLSGTAMLVYMWSRPNVITAAEDGDLQTVIREIDRGADLDTTRYRVTGWRVGEPLRRRETALFVAVREGHTQIVKALLDAGADPDVICTNGSTALIVAAGKWRQAEIVQLLLDANPDLFTARLNGRSALEWSLIRSDYDTFRLLLEAATREGIPDEIQTRMGQIVPMRSDDLWHLIDRVCNESDSDGPLHHAARAGSPEHVKRALAAGADPMRLDASGWSALHWASGPHGNAECVRLLLDAGANPNVATPNGYTPLMAAIQADDPSRVRLLIGAGADVHAADFKQRTPLHIAAWHAEVAIIEVLLEAGASDAVQNSSTQRPSDIASARLRSLGEDVTGPFRD